MNCGVGKHFFLAEQVLHTYFLGNICSISSLDSLLQIQTELLNTVYQVPFEFEARSPKEDMAKNR